MRIDSLTFILLQDLFVLLVELLFLADRNWGSPQ